MKRVLFIAIALLFVLPNCALAQKKKRAATTHKPAPITPVPPPKTDTRMEATQVADTIKALTKFIFLYGKIVNGLEVADEQAKKGRLAPRQKKSLSSILAAPNFTANPLTSLYRCSVNAETPPLSPR